MQIRIRREHQDGQHYWAARFHSPFDAGKTAGLAIDVNLSGIWIQLWRLYRMGKLPELTSRKDNRPVGWPGYGRRIVRNREALKDIWEED